MNSDFNSCLFALWFGSVLKIKQSQIIGRENTLPAWHKSTIMYSWRHLWHTEFDVFCFTYYTAKSDVSNVKLLSFEMQTYIFYYKWLFTMMTSLGSLLCWLARTWSWKPNKSKRTFHFCWHVVSYHVCICAREPHPFLIKGGFRATRKQLSYATGRWVW